MLTKQRQADIRFDRFVTDRVALDIGDVTSDWTKHEILPRLSVWFQLTHTNTQVHTPLDVTDINL